MKRSRLTRGNAIRAFCYECNSYQQIVRKCTAKDCPLWPFRLGNEDSKANWPLIIEKLKENKFFRNPNKFCSQ